MTAVILICKRLRGVYSFVNLLDRVWDLWSYVLYVLKHREHKLLKLGWALVKLMWKVCKWFRRKKNVFLAETNAWEAKIHFGVSFVRKKYIHYIASIVLNQLYPNHRLFLFIYFCEESPQYLLKVESTLRVIFRLTLRFEI